MSKRSGSSWAHRPRVGNKSAVAGNIDPGLIRRDWLKLNGARRPMSVIRLEDNVVLTQPFHLDAEGVAHRQQDAVDVAGPEIAKHLDVTHRVVDVDTNCGVATDFPHYFLEWVALEQQHAVAPCELGFQLLRAEDLFHDRLVI